MYPQSDQTIPSDMFIVAHSLECDDIPGIAWSLLNGWLQNPAEQASVHTLTDASETVQGMDYQNVAWHCGGGNQHGSGHEIVGRAGWSPDQWGTASMDKAFRSLASVIARKWVHRTMPHLGITYLPEWLSLTQIAAQNRAGLVTHNDMRLVFGGTTHTDPGPNYPYKKLRDYIHADIALLLGTTPITPPVPEDDMSQQDKDNIAELQRQVAAQAKQITALTGLSQRISAATGVIEGTMNKIRVNAAQTNGVVNALSGVVNALKARVK